MQFDSLKHKCLVLASDGLWNLLDHNGAVTTVEMTDRKWFREAIYEKVNSFGVLYFYYPRRFRIHIILVLWFCGIIFIWKGTKLHGDDGRWEIVSQSLSYLTFFASVC